MIKPSPNLDQVYQIVLQEEKQRSLSSTTSVNSNSAAFHSYISGDSFKNNQFQQRSYSQGISRFNSVPNSGQQQSNLGSYKMGQKSFPDKNFQEKRTYFCDHYKTTGHSTQRRFKLHGYPPGHKFYKGRRIVAIAQTKSEADNNLSQSPASTAEQYNQLMQLLEHHTPITDKPNENGGVVGFFAGKTFCFLTKSTNGSVWIVDSGANDHVTHDLSLLHNIKKLIVPCFITMIDEKTASITHPGFIYLRKEIELHSVLYIPTFQYNLLSISKLVRQLSTTLIFTPTSCVLQAPTIRKELLLSKEHKGLSAA